MKLTRRALLQTVGGLTAAAASPLGALLPRYAHAGSGVGERVIFFYFPDGVAGPSQDGDLTKWHAWGSEFSYTLGELQQPLEPWRNDCVFLNGLSMGPTDAGSHPGGAQKLLTASDHAGGESIDQLLARTIGASSPWRHLYLGAHANVDNASGDKHISYPTAGASIPPIDDPREAFDLMFGSFAGSPPETTGGTSEPAPSDLMKASVLDAVIGDVESLRTKLGAVETTKLDLHLDALREVEQRLGGLGPDPGEVVASCDQPAIDTAAITDSTLHAPETFPDVLRAQIDLMVLAMACGMTRVGTLQCSHHTSELIMSRFPGTEMHDPSYDMRSHQASHYGARHDPASREYTAFVQQRKYWVGEFAYLLQRLAETPEGDGSMLDNTVVVLCSEVCDGNTHSHDNMPFVVAGRAGGCISTGRLLDTGYQRHGDLWVSIANAMGEPLTWFGDSSSGPVWGLTS